jgi:transposase-like protein
MMFMGFGISCWFFTLRMMPKPFFKSPRTNTIWNRVTKVECLGSLNEIVHQGVLRILAVALQVEVEEYVQKAKDARDAQGHALVVRNGRAQERTVTLGVGQVAIRASRVEDRRPGGYFTSRILPPHMRRSPQIQKALPILYLKGLSTGDFSAALSTLFGAESAGFSASTINRLLQVWQEEYQAWRKRRFEGQDYVYLWADGLHFQVRLEEDRLACLIIMGALADGRKEVIAIEDGYRESTESWASLLRDLRARGLVAPVLAVADGALGFWKALCEVYPETREQRCWVHKLRNVLDKLPKRLQPRAKEMLHEAMQAPGREDAGQAIARFVREYQAAYPKATACLLADQEQLLTFFDFPAEHWLHLRTTNPIESPFATVKVRTRKTKGVGSRRAGAGPRPDRGLALSAERHWRKISAPHWVALVRAGARFYNGLPVSGQVQLADSVATVTAGIAA